MKHTAGDLRERVELLDCTLTDEGWKWVKYAEIWARVELTGKTCIFSKLGIGARAAEVILRSRALTLHQAIRWRGQHLFLSEIIEPERGWLDISAAVVELSRCREVIPSTGDYGPEFYGALTLKYQNHAQETPMATLSTGYVLVVPKPIKLTPGRLVEIIKPGDREDWETAEAFEVRTDCTLDPYKNEYEVAREREL